VDVWIQDYPNQTKTYKMRQYSVYVLIYNVTAIEPNLRVILFAPKL